MNTKTKMGIAIVLVASWSSVAMSAQSKAQPKPCDRQCLNSLVDTYVAAMVAHDPTRAPLATDVKIVENVKRIKAGEGLWKSITAPPTTFRIYVPDVVSQQVGYMALLQADGKPVQLALRLKVESGHITEAEHLVVSNIREINLPHFDKPRLAFSAPVTTPYRDSYGRLLYMGASYYDALDNNNGSLAPFADDCVRFENGMQTVRNIVPSDPSQGLGLLGALGCTKQIDTGGFEYITRIDNRRVWIADEENGLVFGLSHFRHAMDKKEYHTYGVPGREVRTMDNKPFDMPAAHIYKIWGGQIHEIEAVGVSAPYNSPTGWE